MALARYRREFIPHRMSEADRAWYLKSDGSLKYDAFSHSGQCDGFLSVRSPVTGGLQHLDCRCWCHTPDYDQDSVPDYVDAVASAETFVGERADDAVETPFTDGWIMDALTPDEWREIRAATMPVIEDESDDPLCELCSEPESACECVTYDEATGEFKNARGEVVRNAQAGK